MTNRTNITLLILVAIIMNGCVPQSDNSNISSCTSTISTSPSYPVVIADVNNGIKFDFHSYYTPQAYTPSTAPYPDYNTPGWGFFTLLGDGNYTWDATPYHEYKEETVYPDVYFEYTKIKDVNPPPASIINPLTNVTVTPCVAVPTSTTNSHDILNGNEIAFDESRPAFCGYTFVQIFKIGNKKIPKNSQVKITYSNQLLMKEFLPYYKMPFKSNINTSTPGVIIITTNRDIFEEEEIPLFIQFENRCQSTCDPCTAQVCIGVNDIAGNKVIIEEGCREFKIQNKNPFDPNWLSILPEICVDPNNYQKYPVQGCFYYYSNGDPTLRKVTLTITGTSSNILRLKPKTNGNYIAQRQSGNNKELVFESCDVPNSSSCYKIAGISRSNDLLSVLECIDFDVVLMPNSANVVTIDFESHFDGLLSYTSTLTIPIDCETNDIKYRYTPSLEDLGSPVAIDHGNSSSDYIETKNIPIDIIKN